MDICIVIIVVILSCTQSDNMKLVALGISLDISL